MPKCPLAEQEAFRLIHIISRPSPSKMPTEKHSYCETLLSWSHDIVLQSIRSKAEREAVLVDFKPVEGSRIGELTASLDIVVDTIPEDPSEDLFRNLDGSPVEDNPDPRR